MSSFNQNIVEELTYNCPQCDINFAVLQSYSSSYSPNETTHCPQCNTVTSYISSTPFDLGNSDDDYESDDEESQVVDDSMTSVQTVEISSSMLSESSDDDSALTCSICLEDFVVGESAKRLPCNHLFHSDCIAPWLTTHNSCPLCRFEFPVAASGDDNEVILYSFDVLGPEDDWEEEDIEIIFNVYQSVDD